MRFAVLLLAFLAAPILSAQHAVPSDGQWLIEPGEHAGTVQLAVHYGERGYSRNWSRDVPQREVVGLSAADAGGSGVTVPLQILRPAGPRDCEGRYAIG